MKQVQTRRLGLPANLNVFNSKTRVARHTLTRLISFILVDKNSLSSVSNTNCSFVKSATRLKLLNETETLKKLFISTWKQIFCGHQMTVHVFQVDQVKILLCQVFEMREAFIKFIEEFFQQTLVLRIKLALVAVQLVVEHVHMVVDHVQIVFTL